jgi:hypothetical protein
MEHLAWDPGYPLQWTPSWEPLLLDTSKGSRSREPPPEDTSIGPPQGTTSRGHQQVTPKGRPRGELARGTPTRDSLKGTNSSRHPPGDHLQENPLHSTLQGNRSIGDSSGHPHQVTPSNGLARAEHFQGTPSIGPSQGVPFQSRSTEDPSTGPLPEDYLQGIPRATPMGHPPGDPTEHTTGPAHY